MINYEVSNHVFLLVFKFLKSTKILSLMFLVIKRDSYSIVYVTVIIRFTLI